MNAITIKQEYAIPSTKLLQWKLAGSKIFKSLDLRSAYHAIDLDPETQLKCAVKTNSGTWIFQKMCFGLKNGPFSFALLISKVLEGIEGIFTYFDDILIHFPDTTLHLETVEKIFQRLKANCLYINMKKCKFAVDKILY